MPARWVPVVAVVACVLLPAPAWAAEPPAALRDLAVLDDPSGRLGVGEVAVAPPERFRPLPSAGWAGGYTDGAHWLRFTVEAPAGEWWLDLLPAFVDDFQLYEPDPDRPGAFLVRRAGDALPFAAREVAYRGFVFKLQLANTRPRTYYLRVASTSTTAAYPRLWRPDAFLAATSREQALLLVAPVVVLTVLLLNVGAWRWLPERLVPWFLAYAACVTVTLLANAGFLSQFVLPDRPEAGYYVMGLATTLSVGAGHALYRRLFMVTRAQPMVYWLYTGMAAAGVLASVPVLLGYNREVMRTIFAVTPLMNVVGTMLAVRLWRRGGPGGLPMLAANLMSMLGIFVFSLAAQGVILDSAALLYGVPAALMGSTVALHLALTERHRALLVERQQALDEAARERRVREQQGRFIDLISHEYRTPLAVLQTNLDILGRSDDAPRRAESVQRMGAALRRLADVFAKAQRATSWAGHHQIEREPVDVSATLREVLADADLTSPGLRDRVTLDVPAGLVADADATLLKTVLRNLLDNAAKYAVPATPIAVRLAAGPHGASLEVANACVPDPALEAGPLLRGGVRGASSAGHPGLGMGLHLAHRLAADMGADLDVGLDVPGRFTVTLRLPRPSRTHHA